jgi:hypothetical protein
MYLHLFHIDYHVFSNEVAIVGAFSTEHRVPAFLGVFRVAILSDAEQVIEESTLKTWR